MEDSLRRKREHIVRGWTEEALSLFPEDARGFLSDNRDPFANPAGTTIAEQLAVLFEALLEGFCDDEVRPPFERVVQITCVQEVPASQAVGFVFSLKELLREKLTHELAGPRGDETRAHLLELERRVDRLALVAFDCYTAHRGRIADLRVQEVRKQVATLLRRVEGEWADGPPGEPETCASGGRGVL